MKNIVFVFLLSLLSSLAGAQQLKIAALAPDGSSWMESLKAAGDRIEQATDGTVRVRFYPGGVIDRKSVV